ncbi:HAD family hydrolase [Hydrogenimonas sp.]
MRTVIFDLDGTLVDTREDITASINHVRAECYGLGPLTSRTVVELMNRPGLNLAYEFYGVSSYGEEARALFEAHYSRQCLLNARCFEGIEKILESFCRRGVEMFVATNAPTATSRLILQNNGIAHYFKDVVGADRVTHPKPHPQMLERIVSGRRRDRCWMVGDSLKDIMAATDAGITPIFAAWGFAGDGLPVEETCPKALKPADLEDLIENTMENDYN